MSARAPANMPDPDDELVGSQAFNNQSSMSMDDDERIRN